MLATPLNGYVNALEPGTASVIYTGGTLVGEGGETLQLDDQTAGPGQEETNQAINSTRQPIIGL